MHKYYLPEDHSINYQLSIIFRSPQCEVLIHKSNEGIWLFHRLCAPFHVTASSILWLGTVKRIYCPNMWNGWIQHYYQLTVCTVCQEHPALQWLISWTKFIIEISTCTNHNFHTHCTNIQTPMLRKVTLKLLQKTDPGVGVWSYLWSTKKAISGDPVHEFACLWWRIRN
jgi:hypothetical protein